MKKLILLLALVFVMCGCGKEVAYKIDNIKIVVIDSCEYIKTYSYGISNNYNYSHKGNCKFCAERLKKEQEELIRKIKEQ